MKSAAQVADNVANINNQGDKTKSSKQDFVAPKDNPKNPNKDKKFYHCGFQRHIKAECRKKKYEIKEKYEVYEDFIKQNKNDNNYI